jgi:hypothetical protein
MTARVVNGPHHRPICSINTDVSGSALTIASGILTRVISIPLSRTHLESGTILFRTVDLIPRTGSLLALQCSTEI